LLLLQNRAKAPQQAAGLGGTSDAMDSGYSLPHGLQRPGSGTAPPPGGHQAGGLDRSGIAITTMLSGPEGVASSVTPDKIREGQPTVSAAPLSSQ